MWVVQPFRKTFVDHAVGTKMYSNQNGTSWCKTFLDFLTVLFPQSKMPSSINSSTRQTTLRKIFPPKELSPNLASNIKQT